MKNRNHWSETLAVGLVTLPRSPVTRLGLLVLIERLGVEDWGASRQRVDAGPLTFQRRRGRWSAHGPAGRADLTSMAEAETLIRVCCHRVA